MPTLYFFMETLVHGSVSRLRCQRKRERSDARAHLDKTTRPAGDFLSPRRRSGERVRERGFQKSATNRWNEPLSPALSPLVPRRERERQTSAVVGVSRAPVMRWRREIVSAQDL